MSSRGHLPEATIQPAVSDPPRVEQSVPSPRRPSRWRWPLPFLPAAGLLGLVIVGWQLYVDLSDVSETILVSPTAVASTIVDRWAILEPELMATLAEVLKGFALASVVGIGLGVLISSSRVMRLTLYPLIVTSQAVPVIAIAPLLITWFGFGSTSKVLVSALVAFFPIVVNSAAGLASLDEGVVTLMRSFPASRLQIFLRARLPNALPQIFSGLKVGVVLAVIGAVVGEWVGADEGLGYLIVRANASLTVDLVFACIVLLAAMGIVLFIVVNLVEQLVLPWRRKSR
jgi:NitT/TauT family transport system permease protein